MTTFKQIVGRGTRIEEDYDKYFFTIMDFKKATELFKDPDFDGEPVVIYEPGDGDDPVPPDTGGLDDPGDDDIEEQPGVYKVTVSGVPAKIVAERIEYLGPDGMLITESYKDFTRKQIQTEFASLDEFLKRWNDSNKKQVIVDLLEEHGILFDNLAEEVGKDYGIFDLICHIAYDQPPLTRKERALNVKKRNYFTQYGEQARAVLDALLETYADEDIGSLENSKILKLKPFSDLGTPVEIINQFFGGKSQYQSAIQELEQELFKQEQSA
jgi:type I restriction enzyme R subunit